MIRTSDIRETIVKNTFPPKFDRELWRNRETFINCYAYALNCVANEEMARIFGEVGRISNLPDLQEPIQRDDLQKRFLKDIETLGLKAQKTDNSIVKGEYGYKIGVCISSFGDDFHFIRQEKNGIWSHKLVNDIPRILCGVTENPAWCLEDGYEIIEYFLISF